MYHINQACVIMPTALVVTVLLTHYGRGLSREQLIEKVYFFFTFASLFSFLFRFCLCMNHAHTEKERELVCVCVCVCVECIFMSRLWYHSSIMVFINFRFDGSVCKLSAEEVKLRPLARKILVSGSSEEYAEYFSCRG